MRRNFRVIIALLVFLLLATFAALVPTAAQGPQPAPPPGPSRELERELRNAPALAVPGRNAAFGGGHYNPGTIQASLKSTTDRSSRPAPFVDSVSQARGEDPRELAFLATKDSVRRGAVQPQSGVTYPADPAGRNAPNAPNVSNAPFPMNVAYEAVYHTGWIPPDPQIAATPTDVIVAMNSSFYIFDKQNPGHLLYSIDYNSWYGYSYAAGWKIFDPKLVYDFVNNRVVMVTLARNQTTVPKQSLILVSVSRQPSAIGDWYSYWFDATLNGSTSTSNWADYPSVGTDGIDLYISMNMFDYSVPNAFQYAKVRMFKLAELYSNTWTSGWWDFWSIQHADTSLAFTVTPTHHYFSTSNMNLVSSELNLSTSSGNVLSLFRIDGRCCWPGTPPSFVFVTTVNTTSAFNSPPNAGQPFTTTLIETGGTRIRSARFYGGDIWATQGCTHNSSAGLCVWGFDSSGTKFFQSNGFGLDNWDYYYPTIAVDDYENIAVVFTRSSGPNSEYASIRRVGARWGSGLLDGSALVKTGEDWYVDLDSANRNRWGDYSGIERDPANNLTFWLFHQYVKPRVGSSAYSGRWSTWVSTAAYLAELFLPLIRR